MSPSDVGLGKEGGDSAYEYEPTIEELKNEKEKIGVILAHSEKLNDLIAIDMTPTESIINPK